jgi:alkaline phosphatase
MQSSTFSSRLLKRLTLCLVVSAVVAPITSAYETVVEVGAGDEWRYLVAHQSPPRSWHGWRFDETSWTVGRAGFGFGNRWATTEIPELRGGDCRLLLRRYFDIPDPGRVNQLQVSVASDGPFIVYLNGREVISSPTQLPYEIDPQTDRPVGYCFNISGVAHELLAGSNLLAIEVRSGQLKADSFLFSCTLQVLLSKVDPVSSEPFHLLRPRPYQRRQLRAPATEVRYLILMICDGWGPQQIEATNLYTGTTPVYQTDSSWVHLWMSTYSDGGEYDPARAWTEPGYTLGAPTDSAAAATAMVTGVKTGNGRISVDADGVGRLYAFSEQARRLGLAVGAVTTVPVSHATPGAFTSHNQSRQNSYAIAAEAFFGDPNATGTVADDPKYGGGYGPTLPPTDLVIGDRAPTYLHELIRYRLFAESGLPGKHRLVEGASGIDFGAILHAAASDPACLRLAGLFDRTRLQATAPGNGYEAEAPTLAESTLAALTVLERSSAGFVLLIEGGAVDWAGHANNMDWLIGELHDFNLAAQAVIDWVDSPVNDSSWGNTLVVLTGDHETGYLTRAPGLFPDQPIEQVNDVLIGLEMVDLSSGRRASWLDETPANGRIDESETVYWAWGSSGHSNILIPVYARGVASQQMPDLAVRSDPVRGDFIDNIDLHTVLESTLISIFSDSFESGGTSAWSIAVGTGT